MTVAGQEVIAGAHAAWYVPEGSYTSYPPTRTWPVGSMMSDVYGPTCPTFSAVSAVPSYS